jgi:hypothetical protein
MSIEAALERLTVWCASRDGRTVEASLRPPASDRDLDELRAAIAPYEIPSELETLLRWHNGQQPHPEPPALLPVEAGPLLGTGEAAEAYLWLRDEIEPWQWDPLWLPVLRERWTQLDVEIVADGPGVVIEQVGWG